MIYDEITKLRASLLEEIKEQFFGLPLTIEHYKLCEMRVQTALIMMNSTGKNSVAGISSGIEVETEDRKDDRINKKDHGKG